MPCPIIPRTTAHLAQSQNFSPNGIPKHESNAFLFLFSARGSSLLGSLLGRHSNLSDRTDGKEQPAVPHPRKKIFPWLQFFAGGKIGVNSTRFSSLQLQNPASTGKPLSLEVSAALDLARKHGSGLHSIISKSLSRPMVVPINSMRFFNWTLCRFKENRRKLETNSASQVTGFTDSILILSLAGKAI